MAAGRGPAGLERVPVVVQSECLSSPGACWLCREQGWLSRGRGGCPGAGVVVRRRGWLWQGIGLVVAGAGAGLAAARRGVTVAAAERVLIVAGAEWP
jgi:hypothetical protein